MVEILVLGFWDQLLHLNFWWADVVSDFVFRGSLQRKCILVTSTAAQQ